jgi:hypothetical protein
MSGSEGFAWWKCPDGYRFMPGVILASRFSRVTIGRSARAAVAERSYTRCAASRSCCFIALRSAAIGHHSRSLLIVGACSKIARRLSLSDYLQRARLLAGILSTLSEHGPSAILPLIRPRLEPESDGAITPADLYNALLLKLYATISGPLVEIRHCRACGALIFVGPGYGDRRKMVCDHRCQLALSRGAPSRRGAATPPAPAPAPAPAARPPRPPRSSRR